MPTAGRPRAPISSCARRVAAATRWATARAEEDVVENGRELQLRQMLLRAARYRGKRNSGWELQDT